MVQEFIYTDLGPENEKRLGHGLPWNYGIDLTKWLIIGTIFILLIACCLCYCVQDHVNNQGYWSYRCCCSTFCMRDQPDRRPAKTAGDAEEI